MSKTKYPRALALEVAKEIGTELQPFCERITVAGSLRRGKQEVGDLELLLRGRIESRPDGLFDRKPIDQALEEIDRLLAIGMIAKRPNVAGHFAWGVKNRLALHCATQLPVDFFSEPDPLDWWRSLIIRTGSKETNIRLITTAEKHGVRVGAYAVGLTDIKTGERIPCNSEQEFFAACHCPYLEPRDRRA